MASRKLALHTKHLLLPLDCCEHPGVRLALCVPQASQNLEEMIILGFCGPGSPGSYFTILANFLVHNFILPRPFYFASHLMQDILSELFNTLQDQLYAGTSVTCSKSNSWLKC